MRLYLESPQLRVDLERRHEHIEDRIDAPTGVHFVSHETRLEQHPKHEARLHSPSTPQIQTQRLPMHR